MDSVKNNQFILRSDAIKARAKYAIDAIDADAETAYEVLIRPYKKKRSNEANALYWKWISIIAAHLGTSKDELHEYYKFRFAIPILCRDDPGFNKMMQAVKAASDHPENKWLLKRVCMELSTTKLNTKQMSEYMTEVEQHALSLDIRLPHPDDRRFETL